MVDICTEGLPELCFLGYHRLVQSYRVKHSLLFITSILSYFHEQFAPNLASRSTFELSLYPLEWERSWERWLGDGGSEFHSREVVLNLWIEILLGGRMTFSQG